MLGMTAAAATAAAAAAAAGSIPTGLCACESTGRTPEAVEGGCSPTMDAPTATPLAGVADAGAADSSVSADGSGKDDETVSVTGNGIAGGGGVTAVDAAADNAGDRAAVSTAENPAAVEMGTTPPVAKETEVAPPASKPVPTLTPVLTETGTAPILGVPSTGTPAEVATTDARSGEGSACPRRLPCCWL